MRLIKDISEVRVGDVVKRNPGNVVGRVVEINVECKRFLLDIINPNNIKPSELYNLIWVMCENYNYLLDDVDVLGLKLDDVNNNNITDIGLLLNDKLHHRYWINKGGGVK